MAEFTTADPVDVITDRFDEQSRRMNCMQNDIDCLEEMMGDRKNELDHCYNAMLDHQEIQNDSIRHIMSMAIVSFIGSSVALALSILNIIL